MADVDVIAEKPDDAPASLAARSGKLLLGGGLALSTFAHLTLGGVVLFASPRLFATMPENSMMVDIVTPQELADAQQGVENVAEPAKPEQTVTQQQAPSQRQSDQRSQQAASPRPSLDPQQAPSQRQSDQRSQQAASSRPPPDPQQAPSQRQSDLRPQQAAPPPPGLQSLLDPQAPLQRQSDVPPQAVAPQAVAPQAAPPQAAPPKTAASDEQTLPDPTQVAALLDLSNKVANPNLDGTPADSSAKLSADEIAAFKEHVKTCWVSPTAAGSGAKPTAVVRVSLGPNGRLRAEPDLVSISNASSTDGLALVNSVKRALNRCQPYSVLPTGKYQEWKVLDLYFSTDGIADVGSPQNGGKGG
jgi:hypothetical protein